MSQERKESNRRPVAVKVVPVAAAPAAGTAEPQPPAQRRASSTKPKPPARSRASRPAVAPVVTTTSAKPAAKQPAPVRKPRTAAAKSPAKRVASEAALEPPIEPAASMLAGSATAPTIAFAVEPTPAPAEPARFELSESELRERIGRRATEIWLSHGGMAQGPIEDWLQAEAEVRRTLEVVACV